MKIVTVVSQRLLRKSMRGHLTTSLPDQNFVGSGDVVSRFPLDFSAHLSFHGFHSYSFRY